MRRYVGFKGEGHFSLHSKTLRVISSKIKNLGGAPRSTWRCRKKQSASNLRTLMHEGKWA